MDTLRKSMRSTKSPKATVPPLSRDSATATSLTLERQGQPSPETDTSSASRCSTKISRSQYHPRRLLERQRRGPTRPTLRRPFQRTENLLDRAIKALCSLLQSQGMLVDSENPWLQDSLTGLKTDSAAKFPQFCICIPYLGWQPPELAATP